MFRLLCVSMILGWDFYLVRSWVRVRRVSLGRESSEGEILRVDVLVCYGCVAGGVSVLC